MKRVFFCFFGVFLSCYQSKIFAQAKVSKISSKNGAVQIELGKDSGFSKGSKVCILDDKGKKITCTAILSIKETEAIIKIDKEALKNIKKGQKVALDDKSPAKQTAATAEPAFMVARALWAGALMPQATYQHVNYLPPTAKSTVTSLWQQTGAASGLGLSFAFEIEKPNWSTSVGFRFRKYQSGLFSENYNKPADVYGVEGTIDSSSIGFYADYGLFTLLGLDFAFGLDVDMNTLSLTATKTDDSKKTASQTLAEVSSSLTTISLRFPIKYQLNLGSFGINMGTNIILPLAGTAVGTATVKDTDHKSMLKSPTTQDQDLLTQLDHKKNSFAVELIFGFGYAF